MVLHVRNCNSIETDVFFNALNSIELNLCF